jgi:hypothetical protein
MELSHDVNFKSTIYHREKQETRRYKGEVIRAEMK